MERNALILRGYFLGGESSRQHRLIFHLANWSNTRKAQLFNEEQFSHDPLAPPPPPAILHFVNMLTSLLSPSPRLTASKGPVIFHKQTALWKLESWRGWLGNEMCVCVCVIRYVKHIDASSPHTALQIWNTLACSWEKWLTSSHFQLNLFTQQLEWKLARTVAEILIMNWCGEGGGRAEAGRSETCLKRTTQKSHWSALAPTKANQCTSKAFSRKSTHF